METMILTNIGIAEAVVINNIQNSASSERIQQLLAPLARKLGH